MAAGLKDPHDPAKVFHAHGAGTILFRWLNGQEIPPQECMIVGPAGTGKSLNVGKFLWCFLDRWPRSKVLVLRKTRVSLNESWLDTFENEVLGPGHYAIGSRGRENRTHYDHQNGSQLVLGGMDQPRRLFSTQYHIIFANELTELTEIEWMSLHRALRRPGGPGWHLLLGDANPDAEFHWAHRRFPDPMPYGKRRVRHKGRERILSFHRDNPTATKEYLTRLDTQLVGHTRDRLFLGLWRTASGLLYQQYSPFTHLQTGRLIWDRDSFGKPLRDQPVACQLLDLKVETTLTWFAAGLDFGHTAPGALEVFGIDQEGRAVRVAEVYHTDRDLEWWADWVADLWMEFRMRDVWADSANPEGIRRMNAHLRKRGVPSIVRPVVKPKHKMVMFNAVRELLRPRMADGFPSLLLLRDSLRCRRDPALEEAKKPCTAEEEVTGLVIRAPRETDRGQVIFEEEDPAAPNHAWDAIGYFALSVFGKDKARKPAQISRLVQDTHLALAEDAYDLARKERRKRKKGSL